MTLTIIAFALIFGAIPATALNLNLGVTMLAFGAFLYGLTCGSTETKMLRQALRDANQGRDQWMEWSARVQNGKAPYTTTPAPFFAEWYTHSQYPVQRPPYAIVPPRE